MGNYFFLNQYNVFGHLKEKMAAVGGAGKLYSGAPLHVYEKEKYEIILPFSNWRLDRKNAPKTQQSLLFLKKLLSCAQIGRIHPYTC